MQLSKRRRDDNKNKICAFEGVGLGAREENRPKTLYFVGKRHDNKILKVQILLSRNFVVIAQAPTFGDAEKLLRGSRTMKLKLIDECTHARTRARARGAQNRQKSQGGTSAEQHCPEFYPKGPAILKILRRSDLLSPVVIYYCRSNSRSAEISGDIFPGKQGVSETLAVVFCYCRSVLLPP